jgi:hypothetical protein
MNEGQPYKKLPIFEKPGTATLNFRFDCRSPGWLTVSHYIRLPSASDNAIRIP